MDRSKRLETVREMQEFADFILYKLWRERLYNGAQGVRVKVKPGQGRKRAIGLTNEIRMPKWSRSELIVCHEIAHSISSRLYGDSVSHHGPEWARIYLTLTKLCISFDMAQRLAVEFRRNGVNYTPDERAYPS